MRAGQWAVVIALALVVVASALLTTRYEMTCLVGEREVTDRYPRAGAPILHCFVLDRWSGTVRATQGDQSVEDRAGDRIHPLIEQLERSDSAGR